MRKTVPCTRSRDGESSVSDRSWSRCRNHQGGRGCRPETTAWRRTVVTVVYKNAQLFYYYECVCVFVCVSRETHRDDVMEATSSAARHNADVSTTTRRVLTRSTSDKSPAKPAQHHQRRPVDDRSGLTETETPWPVHCHRSTLPRVSRVTEHRPAQTADVWRPMNELDPSERQSFEPAARKGQGEGQGQGNPVTERSSLRMTKSNNDQPPVWSCSTSSPWEPCSSTSRQTHNHDNSDYCNSLTQPPQSPGPLSRSWFDIDKPVAHSSVVGLGCLRLTSSTDVDKTTAGLAVCSICSTDAFITESPSYQPGSVSRDPGYRGGSLPRCYGQRAGETAVPGTTGSMPRGLSMFTPGSTLMPSSEHRSTGTGSDVRPVLCPSPKRSLSSRDDEGNAVYCSSHSEHEA